MLRWHTRKKMVGFGGQKMSGQSEKEIFSRKLVFFPSPKIVWILHPAMCRCVSELFTTSACGISYRWCGASELYHAHIVGIAFVGGDLLESKKSNISLCNARLWGLWDNAAWTDKCDYIAIATSRRRCCHNSISPHRSERERVQIEDRDCLCVIITEFRERTRLGKCLTTSRSLNDLWAHSTDDDEKEFQFLYVRSSFDSFSK